MDGRVPFLGGHAVAVAAALLVLTAPSASFATPHDYLPVGDPLESELRVLDILGPRAYGERLRLPRLDTRPLQIAELLGPGAPPDAPLPGGRISMIRLERALARDA